MNESAIELRIIIWGFLCLIAVLIAITMIWRVYKSLSK